MIIHEPLFAFALTCIAIELTPGPNMTYLALLSAMEGRKAGFSAVIGTTFGLLVVGIAMALGGAALMTQSPTLYDTLRWVGFAYLLWLAYDCWRGKEPLDATDTRHHSRFFLRGLIVNLLNPKAALFYITVLPAFTVKDAPLLPQALLLTLLSVGIATFTHSLIVVLGARAKPYMKDARIAGHARHFFAILLVVVAVWFAYSTH